MSSLATPHAGVSRLKLFWALSRTPHGLLDMATPALGALLWLGRFPPMETIVLGLITAFAGYTAVYALNDVIDYRVDQAKIRLCGPLDTQSDLDALLIRHPMAQGYLSFKAGLLWTLGWSVLAVIGAWRLNPVCILIFLTGCILETAYCLLLKVTHLRTLLNGGVKTMGALAGVLAVDPRPSPLFLALLFGWLFCWEIGGQNIPNDWTDVEEDRRIAARTVPVRFGPDRSKAMILGALLIAVLSACGVLGASPIHVDLPFGLAVVATGFFLLLLPAVLLFKTEAPYHAMALFNMASYYPPVLLAVVVFQLLR